MTTLTQLAVGAFAAVWLLEATGRTADWRLASILALAVGLAVGWFIEEYARAQVSINLVDYHVTGVHHAFDAAEEEEPTSSRRE
jgi:hypothetical protein